MVNAVHRSRERRAWGIGLASTLASSAALGPTTTSCSRYDHPLGTLDLTAATPASSGGAGASDAGIADAARESAAPVALSCETPPCAVALTTTLRATDSDRGEGYCARLDDGTVACWGTNLGGQLGRGDVGGAEGAVPVRVTGLDAVTSLDHTCAVDGAGAVWCWGAGPWLQADDAAVPPDEASVTMTGRPVPIPLPGPAERVAVTTKTACALLRDERVVCWGANERLQVAMDEDASVSLSPREIALPSGVKDLVMGDAAFALYHDGTVLSWGGNPSVGRPTPFHLDGWPAPIAIADVAMIDTVDAEACAVAGGIGWCWGAPVPPASGAPADRYARALPTAAPTGAITRIATSRTWTVTESGSSFVEPRRWCATSEAGEVLCWGLNASGQAGDGTRQYAIEPVVVAGLPARAVDVKLMPHSTCALLANGKVYCWGNNLHGQLGAGLPKGSNDAPQQVKLP
ncbi:MAG: hypothetical protein KF894_00925 [Labilithrix sp.]|nr:hypothetical protein [Labilithrix sp.]